MPSIAKQAPLVPGYPLVGLVPHLLRDSLGTLTDVTSKHGEAVRLRIGPKECHLFAHPYHAQEILAEKAKIYTKEGSLWEAAQNLVGRGIGNTDGEHWVKNRRAMQPQFQDGRFADLARIMGQEMRKSLDQLARRVADGNDAFALFEEVRGITSRVFLRTMFNSSIDDRELESLVVAIKQSFASVETVLWTSFLPSWMPVPGMRKFRAAVGVLDKIVYRIIHERLARRGAEDDLLNLLVESLDVKAGDEAGLRQLRDEVATMIVATQDGPALMLAWGLAMMCLHPEIDATLRREVGDSVGAGDAGLEHGAKLPHTKGVLQEALRLYTPLWLTFRLAIKDDEIDGCTIPKGALVLLCPYLIHCNASFWESPDTFDPTRFVRDGGAPSHRGAYLPFGLGSHLCIGKHLGPVFGQMFMAEFAKRFRVALAPGANREPKGRVSLQPRNAVRAQLTLN